MLPCVWLKGLLYGDDHDCSYDHIQKSERQKHFPTEPHHLIIAKSRHAPTQQNLQPAEKDNFDDKRAHLQQYDPKMRERDRLAPRKVKAVAHEVGNLPPAEKQSGHESRGRDDLSELASKEHEKLTAGIFDVITRDKFRLSFRQVERDTFGLSNGGGEKQQ